MRDNATVTYRLVCASITTLYRGGDTPRPELAIYKDTTRIFTNAAEAMTALVRMNQNHSSDDRIWSIVASFDITEGN